MHRNFKNIDKVCYGKGAFDQMDDILEPKRTENDKFMVFIVDNYFKGKELENRVPVHEEDLTTLRRVKLSTKPVAWLFCNLATADNDGVIDQVLLVLFPDEWDTSSIL